MFVVEKRSEELTVCKDFLYFFHVCCFVVFFCVCVFRQAVFMLLRQCFCHSLLETFVGAECSKSDL